MQPSVPPALPCPVLPRPTHPEHVIVLEEDKGLEDVEDVTLPDPGMVRGQLVGNAMPEQGGAEVPAEPVRGTGGPGDRSGGS